MADRPTSTVSVTHLAVLFVAVGQLLLPEPPTARFPHRPSTTFQDSQTSAAEKLFAEGEQLRATETTESLRKAIAKYEQSLALWRAADNRSGEAAALRAIGTTYSSVGEKRKARDFHKDALALYRSLSDAENETRTLYDLGKATYLENSQEAHDYFSQGAQRAQTIGQRLIEAHCLQGLGVVYDMSGEPQKAIGFHQKALTLYEILGDRRSEAFVLNNAGLAQNLLGKQRDALKLLNRAVLLTQSLGSAYLEAVTLHNIASVYSALDEPQRALDYEKKALPLRRAAGDRRGTAHSLIHIGSIYNSLGEGEKARKSYDEALSLTRTMRDPPGEALALAGIARVEHGRSNLVGARTHVEAALKIIESLRSKLAIQQLRTAYFATAQGQYEFHIKLLMQLHKLHPGQGFDVSAWQASERARARSLLELLAEARADIRQGVDPVLVERERSVQQLVNAKAERYQELHSGPHADLKAAAATERELETLMNELREIEGRIKATSPRYAALTRPEPVSLHELQTEALDADTLLLEYALGEEQSYLWAITRTGFTSYELPKRSEIEAAAQQVYELLTSRSRQLGKDAVYQEPAGAVHAAARWPAAASRLGEMLLGQVAAQLGAKRLLIVSDGALQSLPFAVLPLPGNQSATTRRATRPVPLVVSHEVVSLPSASVLAVLRRELSRRTPAPKQVAVLADPVFDSEDERVTFPSGRRPERPSETSGTKPPVAASDAVDRTASEIDRVSRQIGETDGDPRIPRLLFSWREAKAIADATRSEERMIALNFQASRAAAISPTLAQYRIVHFATHGLLDTERPELSSIVLSLVDERGRPQDGFLRLHEIYNLNLPSDLIVLSACQTGLGKPIKGEGLVGLTRGFMYAGAARVVASLWKVDDAATAVLMKHFYRHMLVNQSTPSAALRAAQVELLQTRPWQEPYYWGAFVLQGEYR